MPVVNSKLFELQTRTNHLCTQLNRGEVGAVSAIKSIVLILSETLSFIANLDNKIRESR